VRVSGTGHQPKMMFPLVRELALEGIPVTLSCRVGEQSVFPALEGIPVTLSCRVGEQSVFPARGITPGGRTRCVTGIGVMRT